MVNCTIEPITPQIGAYVRVAADDVLKEGMPAKIWDALNQYMVLLFPEVNMTDEQLLGLTAALGDMEPAVNTADGSDQSGKGIYRITLDDVTKSKLQQDYVKGNDFWHMDGTSYNVPGKGTLLMCANPPAEGGDTGFANLYAAYDALPEEKKQQIANLRVVHCMAAVGMKIYDTYTEEDKALWDAGFPPTEQPLVWKQKDGRSSLVIGSTAMDIVGMPHEEGYALLQELTAWCTQEQFTYRHKWKKGDLVIFNNPGLLHRSYPYNEASGRLMHRTTLKGVEEIA